jgi:hypothetical protein
MSYGKIVPYFPLLKVPPLPPPPMSSLLARCQDKAAAVIWTLQNWWSDQLALYGRKRLFLFNSPLLTDILG